MLSIIFFLEISLITIIFFYSLYLDLRYRKLYNKILKVFLVFVLYLNFLQFLVYNNNFLFIFIIKITFFFLILFISLLLFSLKIIGGSDGKLIIIIFLLHPIEYLNLHFVILFFLLFSVQFFLLFSLNYVINKVIKNSFSFDFLFIFYPSISISKRIYFQMFYSFINLSKIKIYQNNKIHVNFSFIIYNNKREKLQLLNQYRPPLVAFFMSSYYIIFCFLFFF